MDGQEGRSCDEVLNTSGELNVSSGSVWCPATLVTGDQNCEQAVYIVAAEGEGIGLDGGNSTAYIPVVMTNSVTCPVAVQTPVVQSSSQGPGPVSVSGTIDTANAGLQEGINSPAGSTYSHSTQVRNLFKDEIKMLAEERNTDANVGLTEKGAGLKDLQASIDLNTNALFNFQGAAELFMPAKSRRGRKPNPTPLGPEVDTSGLTAKERNRLAQKRFRERQKSRVQGLYLKVAELAAYVKVYQAHCEELHRQRDALLRELENRGIVWPPAQDK